MKVIQPSYPLDRSPGYGLPDRQSHEQEVKRDNSKKRDSKGADENEDVNRRIRRSLGTYVPPKETPKPTPTQTSLEYEKSVDFENYYLGKYINIVV